MKEFFWLALVFVVVILLLVFGPLATLWALNTLFPVLAIPYNVWSWLAVVALNLTWRSNPMLSYKKG